MPNGQPEQPKVEKTDPKKELEQARIGLHNLRFKVAITEAVIKKLEELSR